MSIDVQNYRNQLMVLGTQREQALAELGEMQKQFDQLNQAIKEKLAWANVFGGACQQLEAIIKDLEGSERQFAEWEQTQAVVRAQHLIEQNNAKATNTATGESITVNYPMFSKLPEKSIMQLNNLLKEKARQ